MSLHQKVWTMVVCIGLGTYCYRFLFLGIISREKLSHTIQKALHFTPAAIISALLVSMILFPHGSEESFSINKILAMAVGAYVSVRSGSTFFTIVAGMVALWVLESMPNFI